MFTPTLYDYFRNLDSQLTVNSLIKLKLNSHSSVWASVEMVWALRDTEHRGRRHTVLRNNVNGIKSDTRRNMAGTRRNREISYKRISLNGIYLYTATALAGVQVVVTWYTIIFCRVCVCRRRSRIDRIHAQSLEHIVGVVFADGSRRRAAAALAQHEHARSVSLLCASNGRGEGPKGKKKKSHFDLDFKDTPRFTP